VPRHVARLVVDYFASPLVWVPRHVAQLIACRRLLRLCRATGCLGTSRGSSRRSSSTTPPRAGSSSTTSHTLRVWVPQHIVRLITRLIAPLVVDYAASRGSSRRSSSTTPRRAACRRLLHLARARRRLLRLRRASGCLGTSHGSSCGSSVVWTSLGPLPRWVPGPTTRWAPGTTRLALHDTCWREAQGLHRRSTQIGRCTCPALYRGLLDVLD
jgi:hypothetical protein